MEVGAELTQLCANERSGDDGKTHASRTGQVVYSFNARGDVHACFGMQCRHVRLEHENQYVCGISGRVVGIEHAGDPDPGWTGRSRTSANPDDTAGTPVGGWVKRRDMYAASVAAYKMANQISDAEISPVMRRRRHPLSQRSSAARCASTRVPTCTRRPRSRAARARRTGRARRSTSSPTRRSAVINKLFIATPKAQPSAPPPDPRLQNLEFVKAAAIRKYVKRCADGESELNLDVLSNVVIHANEFVRARTRGRCGRRRLRRRRAPRRHGVAQRRRLLGADPQPAEPADRELVARELPDQALPVGQEGQRLFQALCGRHPLLAQAGAVPGRRHVRRARRSRSWRRTCPRCAPRRRRPPRSSCSRAATAASAASSARSRPSPR